MNTDILRPSTYVRLAENIVGGTARGVGRAAVRAGSKVAEVAARARYAYHVEYEARMRAKELRAAHDRLWLLHNLPPAQLIEHLDMQAEITQRMNELLASKQ